MGGERDSTCIRERVSDATQCTGPGQFVVSRDSKRWTCVATFNSAFADVENVCEQRSTRVLPESALAPLHCQQTSPMRRALHPSLGPAKMSGTGGGSSNRKAQASGERVPMRTRMSFLVAQARASNPIHPIRKPFAGSIIIDAWLRSPFRGTLGRGERPSLPAHWQWPRAPCMPSRRVR
jgi:hypothetical protein